MTLYEFISPAILPLLSAVVLICQLPFFFKGKEKSRAWVTVIFSTIIIFFSIYEGSSDRDLKADNKKITENLLDSVSKLQDSLRQTRDTLIGIGIEIDRKTGHIILLDSQILKKRFSQVFNVIEYHYKRTAEEMADSANVVAFSRNDSVILYPKRVDGIMLISHLIREVPATILLRYLMKEWVPPIQ